jgi:hypothetical protein
MTKRPAKVAVKKSTKKRVSPRVKQIDAAITKATDRDLGKMLDEDLQAGATIKRKKPRK